MSHLPIFRLCAAAVAIAASFASPRVFATAQIGGVVSLTTGQGGGTCNVSAVVPLTTLQDSFSLSAMTPSLPDCTAIAAGAVHASAALRDVGLRVSSSGSPGNASAQVALNDTYIITPPPGTPTGMIAMPVSFTLEGDVAPGSMMGFGPFLSYDFGITDTNSGFSSATAFSATGQITAIGHTSLTFNGVVSFLNLNQASFPMRATLSMTMLTNQLLLGSVDFYNTGVSYISLPPGFTATTSSGLPVNFAPVPEPATSMLWLTGLMLGGWVVRRRAARQPR